MIEMCSSCVIFVYDGYKSFILNYITRCFFAIPRDKSFRNLRYQNTI